MKKAPVTAVEELWTIPTYPVPAVEEMPMFAETRQHQGTSGDPYPNRVVQKVDREHREDRDYTVVRLENDYIRVVILPALGGRIFEAYDKVNDYHFLYRQHVIKPALIGAFGSWISGGMEFNWPFHHRPSTYLPVDYCIEREEDGSAVCWLSECDPTDRTKGMVGIVLRPDASYFETRVKLTNRTPTAHSFLWWENAAVRVHEQYRLVFPPDVTWAHHHYDRSHTTFPIAQGQYGAERFDEPTDISWHKNSRSATSYFAAPSDFDFFGGYDYAKDSGTIHIANHHVSPGKKMFTWGYGQNAENWENALTDSDGPYAELMAGSYTDDQPDFTWLEPYETKCFSQYWYPVREIPAVTCATLNAAAAVDRETGTVRLNVTKPTENAVLTVRDGDRTVLEERITLNPCESLTFAVPLDKQKYTVRLVSAEGVALLDYTEITPDFIHIPKDSHGIPAPRRLNDAQSLYLAGQHIDQYRDPTRKPDEYYLAALKKEPEHLPSLIALGEYAYRTGRIEEALSWLGKAEKIQNTYNTNPKDGTVSYLTALCWLYLGEEKTAYDRFSKAAWSLNVIARSMTFVSAIDCRRGQYAAMEEHALLALEKEAHHPLAGVYAAYAEKQCGKSAEADARLDGILAFDPLNHLARFFHARWHGDDLSGFFALLHSDPSQTCLDLSFDLTAAGLYEEAVCLLEGLGQYSAPSAMALYVLADCYEKLGFAEKAAEARRSAREKRIVSVFPYRLDEIRVLRAACEADPEDGTAWYLLGCLLYDKRQYAEGAACWEKAIAASPDFYIPYRNLAVACYSHLNRKAEALSYMKQAAERKPGDEQLLNELAYLMASIGVPGAERAAYIRAHMPESCGDDLVLELAKAYNAGGLYDEALDVMLHHSFTPGEGGEFAIAETYMFGRFAKGRTALRDGNAEEALACFRASLKIPENLHAGFWNESVTVPYRYYEAEALSRLGRTEEAKAILGEISKLNNAGMWNMGGEFTYYSAMIARLDGKEMQAQRTLRNAISSWEAQLADNLDAGNATKGGRFFYLSFMDEATVLREADLCYMLGYGMLAMGETEKARSYFLRSLEKNPDNAKCALELALL